MKDYDYSQNGYYYITICTHDRKCCFGKIINGKIQLSKIGEIVLYEWHRSPKIRHEITLDKFIVMPNHVHGIVIIDNECMMHPNVGATGRSPLQKSIGPPKKSLGAFVAGFKSITTKRINVLHNTPGIPFWQRNYYEHIIRNEDELNRIRKYIINNPLQWETDKNNPNNRQIKNSKRKIWF